MLSTNKEHLGLKSDVGQDRLLRAGRGLAVAQVGMITFLVGMVDGAGLLQSGIFVSFMSGNTTSAAVSIAAGETLKGFVLLSTILVYVFGNFVGALVAAISGRRAAVAVLVTAAASIWLAASLDEYDPEFLSIACLIFATGTLNAAMEKATGIRVGLTYVAGALSKLGIGAAHLITGTQKSSFAVSINLVPWLGVLVGAGASSTIFRFWSHLLLVAPGVLGLLLALIMNFRPLEPDD